MDICFDTNVIESGVRNLENLVRGPIGCSHARADRIASWHFTITTRRVAECCHEWSTTWPNFHVAYRPKDPHEDEAGLCGFEKRNRNFKGFGDLGGKGLWTSNAFPEDRRLVIGESAIDCISYEVLFPGGRYASIAGGLNPKQPDRSAYFPN